VTLEELRAALNVAGMSVTNELGLPEDAGKQFYLLNGAHISWYYADGRFTVDGNNRTLVEATLRRAVVKKSKPAEGIAMIDEAPRQSASILAPGLPNPARKPRQIFVAYSYKLYPKADYRRVYNDLAKAFKVDFVFADEKITNLHILQKIANYIRESRFSIYDISGWNPNVTLELGLAFGLSEKSYIAIDPSKTDIDEVPSDLRGMDRIQYASYTELQTGLERLLAQELPVQPTHDVENQLVQLRDQTVKVIAESEGLKIPDIARLLGVSIDMAKLVVRPLVEEGKLRIEGVKRGARYFLALTG